LCNADIEPDTFGQITLELLMRWKEEGSQQQRACSDEAKDD
jgi:hypothetical protein